MNNNRLILIVDDNLKNIQVSAKILKDYGYEIAFADNAISALAVLSKQKPILILLDIMMPEVNGIELCVQIKSIEHLAEIPIIFLTAKNQQEDIIEGFRAGGVDYIIKPFNKEELIARVNVHAELYLSKQMLKEQSHQLESLIETREKMYSIIAHDIRSPMASIILLTDLLARGTMKNDSADFNKVIANLSITTKETSHLLDNLLDWTRLQTGKIQAYKEPIYIVELLKIAKDTYNVALLNKNLTIAIKEKEPTFIFADRNMVKTIIRNLLNNAVKYTPNGGEILLESYKENDKGYIIVADSGNGMSVELIDRILNGENNTSLPGTNNEKGTGLGMNLTKDFIKANDGTFAIESQLGKGSRFIIGFNLLEENDTTN